MRGALLFFLIFTSLYVNALTVTSFNAQWFGLGGVLEATTDDEYRDTRIKQFLTKVIPKSDVIIFQEITQPNRLAKLFSEYSCITYKSYSETHQHIVICAEPSIIKSHTYDDSIRLSRFGLRPAMIVNIKQGDKELSIVGVHLKASSSNTDIRLQQVEALANSALIGTRSMIIGDFNTSDKESTKKEFNDSDYFSEILSAKDYSENVNETSSSTYLGFKQKRLDRVWSRNIKIKSHKVFGPCRKNSVPSPFNKKSFYKRFVSDHCAIQLVI